MIPQTPQTVVGPLAGQGSEVPCRTDAKTLPSPFGYGGVDREEVPLSHQLIDAVSLNELPAIARQGQGGATGKWAIA
jgi:hypothetical protein